MLFLTAVVHNAMRDVYNGGAGPVGGSDALRRRSHARTRLRHTQGNILHFNLVQ